MDAAACTWTIFSNPEEGGSKFLRNAGRDGHPAWCKDPQETPFEVNLLTLSCVNICGLPAAKEYSWRWKAQTETVCWESVQAQGSKIWEMQKLEVSDLLSRAKRLFTSVLNSSFTDLTRSSDPSNSYPDHKRIFMFLLKVITRLQSKIGTNQFSRLRQPFPQTGWGWGDCGPRAVLATSLV